jgi:alpha-D-xyloside xylohydrolase
MRTMFYEFPGDEPCWELKDQYMFGPDILVAPVMEAGALTRQVYLPPFCEWIEGCSGKKYAGGSVVTAEAPLDVIPIFFKDGKTHGVKPFTGPGYY